MQHNLLAISPRLPRILIPPESLLRLSQMAESLPQISDILLEMRLGNDCRVDFSIPLVASQSNLGSFRIEDGDTSKVQTLSPSFLSSPAFRHYLAILDTNDAFRYSDPDHIFENRQDAISKYAPVKRFWLEFDVQDGEAGSSTPAFGIEVDDLPPQDDKFLVLWALDLLSDFGVDGNSLGLGSPNRLPESLIENLKMCTRALPSTAKIIFIGANPSVRNDALRLIIDGLPPCDITGYLLRIGWSGAAEELGELIASLARLVDNIVLSFNIGEVVFPRIGLECYFIDPPHVGDRWKLFMDYLVETNLCSPAKGRALLSWSEMDKAGAFERFTVCTKIVHESDKVLEAKAYLGLWSTDASIQE